MKNRKGFTVIELLVSFVVMAFILGIGVVSCRFIIDRIEANYYDTLEEELLLAGSDYFTNHREDRPFSGYGAVYIDELVADKYIEVLKDRQGNVCSASNDSRVYIYKTDTSYGYEACLVCNEYTTDGVYCDGTVEGVINISAFKENGVRYNPLLSYENSSWSDSDVKVFFSINTPVTEFVITDTSDGSQKKCTDITKNSCNMTFSKTSTYKVEAYDNGNEKAPAKGFNIKIDKTKPVCEFVSGPSVALINKTSTATYVLKCTDNVGLSSDFNITSNDFTLTTSNAVLIQEPVATSITNGYQYTITVSGNSSGSTSLKLNAGAITDKAGNGNASVTSSSITVDANAPGISYSLAAGTYDEAKTITVTATDNRKISSIEYELYKNGVLSKSGNPTVSSPTSVSFDNSLNDDGTWKLDVTVTDEAGNKTTASRSFTIKTVPVCEFISGPTVALINKTSTATYVLECTDKLGLPSGVSLSSSSFAQTTSGIVSIQTPTSTSITNGYRYTIKVSGNSSGSTSLKLNAGAFTDKAGNGNASVTSSSITVDVNAPGITYSLATGTYEEGKTITVTATDNRKISSIEYKLYKNGVLSKSGNPTISSSTSVSFDNSLNDDGTWKLDVTVTDEAGNKTTASRNFTIKTVPVCEFISGPSVALINKTSTATYVLECTDKLGLPSGVSLSSSNFTQTTSGIVSIQTPTSTSITNGYRYTIKVSGNSSGTTSLKLNAGAIADKAGNGNASVTSSSITVDANAPGISYSLAAGTYEEAKTVKVTVTDNRKLSSIEYKLYKNGVLSKSGNPTVSSSTSVSFDNSLNDDGTWKLDVTVIDEAGNKTTDSRSFTINTLKCEWVLISLSSPTWCEAQLKPENPSEGDTYIECSEPIRGKWRFYCPKTYCADGFVINSGPVSEYIYNDRTSAEMACALEWGNSGHYACTNRGGAGSSWRNDCSIQQLTYYHHYKYEYQCN